jgi:hypothetical protein
VERALLAELAISGGLAFVLGVRSALRRGRWNGWLALLAAQLGFAFVHVLAGVSPASQVLRGLGFRTHKEIDAERRDLETVLLDRPEAPQVS